MPDHQLLQKNVDISWLMSPDQTHSVHFYPSESGFIKNLADYFYEGLINDKTCVAIATPEHQVKLNTELRDRGVDLLEAVTTNQFIMLDADATLQSFMENKLPNYERFLEAIQSVLYLAEGRGRPILAFGEMVALLWKEGNSAGLLELEKFWHALVSKSHFSLYCAYPNNMFEGNPQHQSVMNKICDCHSQTLAAQ